MERELTPTEKLESRINVLANRLEAHNRDWDKLADILGLRRNTGTTLMLEHVSTVIRARGDLARRCTSAEDRVEKLEAKLAQLTGGEG